MYNAVEKLLIAATSVLVLISCSNAKKDKAQSYIAEAKERFEMRDYAGALATLDSLDINCASEVEQRREAIRMRPAIMEGKLLREIEATDSIIAGLLAETDEMKANLQYVKDSFEGYYTAKELAGKIPAEKSGLYAKMSPDGVLTVISSSTRKALSTGVTLSANGESASTPAVANDGERNDRSRGVEIITFMPNECDTLGAFAVKHAGVPITLTFDGAQSYSMPLDAVHAHSLAAVYEASMVGSKLRQAQMQKSKLEQQLQVARSQMARTFKPEETDKD